MSFLPDLDAIIQEGRGIASSLLGQTYDVRRLSATTSGSIMSNAPVIASFPAYIRKAKKVAIENQTFDLEVFEFKCDNRTLQLGDVLKETGYQARPSNVYVFAQYRPPRETICVRVEAWVSITRPQPKGGAASQQPGAGVVRQSRYMGVTKAGEQVLTLVNGTYAFDAAGSTPASVPAALSQLNRVRDGSDPKNLSTPLYRTHWAAYLPPLDVKIDDLDRITFGNGDRYEATSVYPAMDFGLQGTIMILEKLAT